MPIEVLADGQAPVSAARLYNVSAGGLCFQASGCVDAGNVVRLRVPVVEPPFETSAVVVWCRPRGQEWEMGVRFLNENDAFRARMVEQICHIEAYRQHVGRTEGRALDAATAAREWIDRYAARFPSASE